MIGNKLLFGLEEENLLVEVMNIGIEGKFRYSFASQAKFSLLFYCERYFKRAGIISTSSHLSKHYSLLHLLQLQFVLIKSGNKWKLSKSRRLCSGSHLQNALESEVFNKF